MRYPGFIAQFIMIAVAIVVAIVEAKNKAAKNKWGGEPESFFEIIKTKVEPTHYPQVKIELRGEGHYVYVRNTGEGIAKNVILHSKYLEPMDSDTDEDGLFIRPGEEITFFATSFDTKKIKRVIISWRDHTGLRKQTFPVKRTSGVN